MSSFNCGAFHVFKFPQIAVNHITITKGKKRSCTGIKNWICKEVLHAATSYIERYYILYEARGVLFIPQAAAADELRLGWWDWSKSWILFLQNCSSVSTMASSWKPIVFASGAHVQVVVYLHDHLHKWYFPLGFLWYSPQLLLTFRHFMMW